MNKKTILPFVVVYPGAIKDPESLLSVIKDSESTSGTDYFSDWHQWDEFGKKVHLYNSIQETSDPNLFKQKSVVKELYDVIYAGYKDYIESWTSEDTISDFNRGKPDSWTPVFGNIVTNWEIEHIEDSGKSDGWMKTTVDIARHKLKTEKEYAIGYHLDVGDSYEKPGPRAIVSATVYLNDDYEGGGISFLNEFGNTIINYKPKAGDMLIFPSGKPFFHAALPSSGGNKYLARHFLTWQTSGSPKWHENEKKFGKEVWEKIAQEVRKAEGDLGMWNKDVYLPGDKIESRVGYNGVPFFATEVIDLDMNGLENYDRG